MHYIFIPLYHQHLASSIILRKAHLTMYSNANKSTQRKIQSYIIMVKSRIRKSSLDVMLEFYLFLLRVTFFFLLCFWFFQVFEYLKGVLGEWGRSTRGQCVLVLGAPALHLASLLLVWCQRLVPRVSTPGVFSGNVQHSEDKRLPSSLCFISSSLTVFFSSNPFDSGNG